jgi:hypothetical protein
MARAVCLDETSKHLLRDTRAPLPAQPGRLQREDRACEREGVVIRFLACAPFVGQRWVTVTERRAKVSWAHLINVLVVGR